MFGLDCKIHSSISDIKFKILSTKCKINSVWGNSAVFNGMRYEKELWPLQLSESGSTRSLRSKVAYRLGTSCNSCDDCQAVEVGLNSKPFLLADNFHSPKVRSMRDLDLESERKTIEIV